MDQVVWHWVGLVTGPMRFAEWGEVKGGVLPLSWKSPRNSPAGCIWN